MRKTLALYLPDRCVQALSLKHYLTGVKLTVGEVTAIRRNQHVKAHAV
jgi:hypothetical protein